MKKAQIVRLRRLGFLIVAPALVAAACGSGAISNNGGHGGSGASGGPGTGGGPGVGGSSVGGSSTGVAGGTGGPVYGGQHPRILANPDNLARLRGSYASSPVWADFKDNVDKEMGGEDRYDFHGSFSGYIYLMTGDVKYGDFAVKFIDDWVASEEALIARNMGPVVADDSYLHVGDYVGDVALVYDWCFDRMTNAQRQRWLAYANQAVWNVWHPNSAKWGNTTMTWSGWAVDNPINNYHSSFLMATEFLGLAAQGDDPMADGWLDKYRNAELGASIFPTYTAKIPQGGSPEGTGYGVEMKRLFQGYDVWYQTTGERIADMTPHTDASALWMMHTIVPTMDYIVTIGDQARESTGALFDYQRDYLQILAFEFPLAQWAPMAQWLLSHCSVPKMDRDYDMIEDLLYQQASAPQAPLTGLYPAYFSKGTGHAFVRSAWSTTATYLTFFAGPLFESHAHADQGSFNIYSNEWLAFDAGYLSSSGLRQEETAHNIPTVSVGTRQATMEKTEDGSTDGKMVALADNAQYTYFASDTANCYQGNGGVTQMERELIYVKPDTVIVFDRISAQSGSTKVWHLNAPVRPTLSGRVATIMGKKSKLTVTPVLPAGVTPTIVDLHAADSDFNGGFRLDESTNTDGRVFFLNVMSVNGSVTAVTEASPSGMRGVTLTLADGRTVTAQFTEATFGASLDITGGSGLAVHGAIPKTVADLPRYAN